MKSRELPPKEFLQEAFEIDSSSPSYLRWKSRPQKHFLNTLAWVRHNALDAGRAVTTISGKRRKHYSVMLNGVRHAVSRIIYKLVHGDEKPGHIVDHINRNSLDNRPENLRLVSMSENSQNRKMQANNSSGFRGVFWRNDAFLWRVSVRVNRRLIGVGHFDNLLDAVSCRRTAAIVPHEHENSDEFYDTSKLLAIKQKFKKGNTAYLPNA